MASKIETGINRKQLMKALAMAMQFEDRWVIHLEYVDKKGVRTRRHVSPIKFEPCGQMFSALCLGREEVRHFILDRCVSADLVHASDVLMPMPIETL